MLLRPQRSGRSGGCRLLQAVANVSVVAASGWHPTYLLFLRQVHRDPFKTVKHGWGLFGKFIRVNVLDRAIFDLMGLI